MLRRPERYWPVREAGFAAISAGVPWATIMPPCTPAPGPEIEHVVGALDGVLIVLDHDHRVAEVPQAA